MSNYLYVDGRDFHMAKEHFNNALCVLVDAAESYDGLSIEHADAIVSSIANTSYTNDSIGTVLAQVIGCCEWGVTFDEKGDIDDIFIEGDYSEDEEALFTILAPFVTQGSFIELDNTEIHYRYAFTGTRMLEQEPHYDPVPDEREEVSERTSGHISLLD